MENISIILRQINSFKFMIFFWPVRLQIFCLTLPGLPLPPTNAPRQL